MNTDFGTRLNDLQLVSPQRWVLALAAMVAALGACVAASIRSGGASGPILLLLYALVVLSLVRPATHAPLLVTAIVIAQCVTTADDPTTPLMIVVAFGLVVFHTIIGLMSITPHNAVVAPAIVRRWSLRMLAVMAATVAVWLLTATLAQRDTAGSVVLTFLGFATLTMLIVAVRALIVRAATASR